MLVVFCKYKYCMSTSQKVGHIFPLLYVKYFIEDIPLLTFVIVIHIFDQFPT